jgi:hypothetical protein
MRPDRNRRTAWRAATLEREPFLCLPNDSKAGIVPNIGLVRLTDGVLRALRPKICCVKITGFFPHNILCLNEFKGCSFFISD